MRVQMANKIYEMNSKQYKGFLKVAKGCLPIGIYAVEKDGVAIMMNEKPKDREERIRELEIDYSDYCNLKREKAERLRKEKDKLHSPTALCAGCKHFVTMEYGYPYGCKLDNKCEDRQEIE